MDFKKMKVAELVNYCNENGIELDGSEKKAEIIEKIEALGDTEVEIEAESVEETETVEVESVEAESTEVQEEPKNSEIKPSDDVKVEKSGKVKAKMKNKQKWFDLGEFDSREDALRVIKRKGGKVYEIK